MEYYNPINDAARFLWALKRQPYTGMDLDDVVELCRSERRQDIIDHISQREDKKIVFDYEGNLFSFYPRSFYELVAVSYFAEKGYLITLNDKMFDK